MSDAAARLLAENATLRAQLAAVEALHQEDQRPGREGMCAGCEVPGVAFVWLDRCRTRQALNEQGKWRDCGPQCWSNDDGRVHGVGIVHHMR